MKNNSTIFDFFLWLKFQAQEKIEYVEYDLPNGIHVILHQENATPIVAVSVLYHVGSKNENPDRTGFAHFFEHLLFEGSENIDRGEYDELVESNGGTLNANTSQDRTFYYEILPSNQLELGLWLESERMLHAKVNNKGIETQRSVVKEEKRQRVDNQPYASFITEMFMRAFPNHPYNWVPIGSMEHLDAAQEEDYVNFYKTFYVPSNATLSIAGDLDIEQTKFGLKNIFLVFQKDKPLIYIAISWLMIIPHFKKLMEWTRISSIKICFLLPQIKWPLKKSMSIAICQLLLNVRKKTVNRLME